MTPDELDAQALSFELRATSAVTGALAEKVRRANAVLAAAYSALESQGQGQVTPKAAGALRRLAAQVYGAISSQMQAELLKIADDGLDLGVEQAREYSKHRMSVAAKLSKETVAAAKRIDSEVAEQVLRTVATARSLPMTSLRDLNTVAAHATRAISRSEATVRWVTNRAINEGSVAVASEAEADLLWVAERDACLHCLAYSGLTVKVGQDFPAELTYADKPLPWAAPYPPRHSGCRCRLRPWGGLPGTVDMSDPEFPSALQREARRSVVRGSSSFASVPARLRSADRLLRAGANLPKTVIARAKKALKAGSFS